MVWIEGCEYHEKVVGDPGPVHWRWRFFFLVCCGVGVGVLVSVIVAAVG